MDRSARRRDMAYRAATRILAVALLPLALLAAPRRTSSRRTSSRRTSSRRTSSRRASPGLARARLLACRWALAARFPAEDLVGLTQPTRAAFEAARGTALWRDGEVIGLTDGYRDEREQRRLFAEMVRRTGSVQVARCRVLPPHESRHIAGTALDVRPVEGARWLERHGWRYHLYRTYDNEWWHFEYWPDRRPLRLPHPGMDASMAAGVRMTARDRG
ncbi:MAG: D-alanyl-D-alanine carboxypeptidase family protein [Micromonosporaceae bacterium]|nr:D-alanyl-D-alanine carboxypeptidase family protein [Micromonosporaceae bacterium]